MANTNAATAAASTLKAYEDKIRAQVSEAKGKLRQVKAQAEAKADDAAIKELERLDDVERHIDRKLTDLKATNDTYVSRAKADITADVSSFEASVQQLAEKVKKQFSKK